MKNFNDPYGLVNALTLWDFHIDVKRARSSERALVRYLEIDKMAYGETIKFTRTDESRSWKQFISTARGRHQSHYFLAHVSNNASGQEVDHEHTQRDAATQHPLGSDWQWRTGGGRSY